MDTGFQIHKAILIHKEHNTWSNPPPYPLHSVSYTHVQSAKIERKICFVQFIFTSINYVTFSSAIESRATISAIHDFNSVVFF